MKRFSCFIVLLLALAILFTACGSRITTEGNSDGSAENQSSNAAKPIMQLDGDLVLMDVSRYAGAFVEDGTDETVSDVMAITVRNDGDKTVQYVHLSLSQNDNVYEFDLTTLPPGGIVQLLELSRQPVPESTEGMTARVTNLAVFDEEPSMYADIFEIETQDMSLTITNKTEHDITGQIYIYYKIAYDELYMGGITYRAGANGLQAGETTACYAGHFSEKYSKIMFVTYVQ